MFSDFENMFSDFENMFSDFDFSRFENISKTFAGCWLEFLVTIIADIVIPLVVAQKAGAINSHPESRSHK